MSIATRPTRDVVEGLEAIAELPTVSETQTDRRVNGDDWELIAVVVLEESIERIPPSVCRVIGEQDFGIDTIEQYGEHLEVALR